MAVVVGASGLHTGKTTMLYALETEPKSVIPTIGFNVEQAAKGKLSLTCWYCSVRCYPFDRDLVPRSPLSLGTWAAQTRFAHSGATTIR